MPIEFFCQGCGKRMRTPDGSGGKQGKCPQCGTLMAIPTTSQAGATKASDAPIEFDCPSCGMVVRTPATSAGKKGRCPHCREVMQIPGTPPVPAKPVAPKPAAQKPTQKPISTQKSAAKGERIAFYCSSCAGVVRTPATAAGKRGKCPHCSTIVDIPFASDPALSASSGGLTLMPSRASGLTPLSADSAGLTPLPFDALGLTPLPTTGDLFLDSPGLVTPELGGIGTPTDPFAGSFDNPAPLGMDGLGSSGGWQTPAVSTNPYAAPSYAPAPTFAQHGGGGSGARTATIVCGILMAVNGGFWTLMTVITAVIAMFAGTVLLGSARRTNVTDDAGMAGVMVGMVVGVILAMAMYATVLIGGIQMARLRQWGLALTASIFSILPMILGIVTLNPCSIAMTVPGVALGIWGIVMLCNASVKRQFR